MTLRPMTMADADFMLKLKNDPDTRRYAIITKDEIKPEDHYAWLEKNLMFFQVIDGSLMPVGAFRYFGREVSIWIDSRFRGLGVATAVLKAQPDGTYAKIVDGNVPSLRAFIKAGFLPVNHVDNYYLMRK